MKDLTPRQMGWIGGGYLSMLTSLPGQTVFISLFGAAVRETFQLSAGQYGLVYTVATLCSAIALVFLGSLADTYSARAIGVGSVIGLAGACLVMSASTSVAVLLLALFGLRFFGQGMLTHNCATALTRWFKGFRGRALALSQFGYSTGEATFPILVALGIAAFGWRGVWQIAAVVLITVSVPLMFLLFRDGSGNPLPTAASHQQAKVAASPWGRAKVVKDSLFWLVIAGVLANPAIVTLIFFHQANLIETKAWDPLVFAASFPVLSVTSAASGMLGGILIDRFGAWRLLPFILLPLGFANFLLFSGSAPWTIALVFFLMGASAGLVIGVVSVIWAELYGTTHLGAIRSLATAALVLASAIGPGFAGILVDWGISIERQCLAYAIYCLVASSGYVLLQAKLATRIRQTALIV